ncbi:MAG: hypothetical protein ACRDKI_03510 [Solirubrobacterales bacterium]
MPPRSENERKERLLMNLLRLRRIDKLIPFNDDVRALQTDLDEQVGDAVSQRLAARMLGVSHPALSKWINSGHLPLVSTPAGKSQVSVEALLELMERADELRDEQPEEERRRPLEAIMKDRGRAAERRPKAGDEAKPQDKAEVGDEERARVLDMRALAHHRAIARNLDSATVREAIERLEERHEAGTIDDADYDEWVDVLAKNVSDIRSSITEDSERGRELRRCSPFERRVNR